MRFVKFRIDKNFNITLLPIVPNELAFSNGTLLSYNSILYSEDIKRSKYLSTGVYQDLSSEIIKKCKHIEYLFLKNIPTSIFKKGKDLKSSVNFQTILLLCYNPNRKKYLDIIYQYIEKNKSRKHEVKKITKSLLDNSLPEDFDIHQHVVYEKEKNIIKYSTLLIDTLRKSKSLFCDFRYLVPDKNSMKYFSTQHLIAHHVYYNGGKEELQKRGNTISLDDLTTFQIIPDEVIRKIVIRNDDIFNDISKLIRSGLTISQTMNCNFFIRGNNLKIRKDSVYKINYVPFNAMKEIKMFTHFLEEKPEMYSNQNSTQVHLYFKKRKVLCIINLDSSKHIIHYDDNKIEVEL